MSPGGSQGAPGRLPGGSRRGPGGVPGEVPDAPEAPGVHKAVQKGILEKNERVRDRFGADLGANLGAFGGPPWTNLGPFFEHSFRHPFRSPSGTVSEPFRVPKMVPERRPKGLRRSPERVVQNQHKHAKNLWIFDIFCFHAPSKMASKLAFCRLPLRSAYQDGKKAPWSPIWGPTWPSRWPQNGSQSDQKWNGISYQILKRLRKAIWTEKWGGRDPDDLPGGFQTSLRSSMMA